MLARLVNDIWDAMDIDSTSQQSLVNDFTNIVQSLAGDVTAMKATPPFSDCEATQAIIDALTDVSRN